MLLNSVSFLVGHLVIVFYLGIVVKSLALKESGRKSASNFSKNKKISRFCGLIRHVLNREVKGSNPAAAGSH